MPKKHEIRFETGRGTFLLQTDDLADLSAQEWFREFLGLALERNQTQSVVQTEVRSKQIQQDLDDLRNMVLELRQSPQSSQQHQVRQREEQVRVQPQPQSVQAAPRLPPYMDVTPDQMTEQVWNTLMPQQRKDWMEAYGVS